MTTPQKAVLLQLWYLLALPIFGALLVRVFGPAGMFLYLFLFILWCWEIYAFAHYRFCRQQEFLLILQTAAATQAPIESVLRAYLEDRPRDEWYRFWSVVLLLFVFPGFYWIHWQRSFDARLTRVLDMLYKGITLDRALHLVPEVVAGDTALAVTVGHFSGRLPRALQRIPERHTAPPWLEMAPRVLYPVMILSVLLSNMAFILIFIMPKFEKIFSDFKLRLPPITEIFMSVGRWSAHHAWFLPVAGLGLLALFNILLFSSRAKWYCPVVGRIYRLHARGQFLQTLGLMLETDRPLPEILERVVASESLPKVVAKRARCLANDLSQGMPLAASLVRHGLATAPQQGLIVAAENARNLPWALQELGETLTRRSARLGYRIAMVVFPLAIFVCACLVAFFAVSLFEPLVAIMESLHGK